MAKLIIRTVMVEAPLPFTDAEGEALVEYLAVSLDHALKAAVQGGLDAAKAEGMVLAESAIVRVTD